MSKFLIFMSLAMIWATIWTNECNARHYPLGRLGPLFSSFFIRGIPKVRTRIIRLLTLCFMCFLGRTKCSRKIYWKSARIEGFKNSEDLSIQLSSMENNLLTFEVVVLNGQILKLFQLPNMYVLDK